VFDAADLKSAGDRLDAEGAYRRRARPDRLSSIGLSDARDFYDDKGSREQFDVAVGARCDDDAANDLLPGCR